MYMDPLLFVPRLEMKLLKKRTPAKLFNRKLINAMLVIIYLIKVDDFTLTAYAELYCDLEWARVFIQSAFPVRSFLV